VHAWIHSESSREIVARKKRSFIARPIRRASLISYDRSSNDYVDRSALLCIGRVYADVDKNL
jgi:hypothetical protein